MVPIENFSSEEASNRLAKMKIITQINGAAIMERVVISAHV